MPVSVLVAKIGTLSNVSLLSHIQLDCPKSHVSAAANQLSAGGEGLGAAMTGVG